MPTERPADMFCISNGQSKHFVMTLLGCACIFCLATLRLKSTNEVMYGRFARARSAWNETSQHQSCVLLASCVPALLYNNMQSLACTVLSDHLRLHFTSTRPGETLLLVSLHTCIMQSAARFYGRHVTWGQPAKRSMARTEPMRWQRLLRLTFISSSVHRLWFWACLLTAAPGVVYSAVKAVSQTESPAHQSMRESNNQGVKPAAPGD
eukprot:5594731-Amphidinium_carterae.1